MRFATGPLTVVLLCVASSVSAQALGGAIRGRVFDRDGVIAKATVSVVHAHTNATLTTTTNGAGEYVFTNLPPGRYHLTAAAAGFQSRRIASLEISSRSASVLDLRLEPAAVQDVITINASGHETTGGPLSTAFSGAALVAQPTAGRNIFIMGTLAPTVIPTGNALFVRQQDQSNSSLISMLGSARRANTYLLDGVPLVDIQNRATIIPGMEAVDELRVELSPYAADVGRTSGGIFNVSSASGTNLWRGSAVYQNRPAATQAQLFFASRAGIESPDTSYHLFAGSTGGPILRNRTFFFVSGEGYRTESPRNTVLRLPTAAERRGDFSQSGVTLYDPLTTRPDPSLPGRVIRDPFPNNQIPASRMNPVALRMLEYVPMPSTGKSLPAATTVLDEARQIIGKITQLWRPGIVTALTYAWYRSAEPDARFFGDKLFGNGADPGDGALVRRVNLFALNHDWAIGSRSMVQARLGTNRFLDDNRGADFDPSTLAFDPRFVNAVPFRKFPAVGVNEYGQGGTFLGDRDRQRGQFYAHVASATLTTLRATHLLRAGGEFRVTGVDFRNLGGSGYFAFTRDFTGGPDPLTAAGSGDAFASFLLGYPAHGSISTSSPIDAYIRYGAGFMEDDWRVSDRVTITGGLRYEREEGLREAHDRMVVGWAADRPFPIQVGGTRPDGTPLVLRGGLIYAGTMGAPTSQGAPARWRWSPRLAATLSISDRMRLRAGYGVFRAPQQGISASEIGTGTRGYNVTTSLVTTLDSPFVPCGTCSLTYPFPEGISQPSGGALGVMTGVGGGVEFVDPATEPAHYHRYSLELRRQLGARVSAGATYAGAAGRNLMNGGSSGAFVDINQLEARYLSLGHALSQPVANPFLGTALGVGGLGGATIPAAQLLRPYPQFQSVYALRSSEARSRYDALILDIERRAGGRWSGRTSYTFSRQRDNQYSESNFFNEGSAIRNYYDIEAEYGPSVLDTPHRITASGTAMLPAGFSISASATLQSGFPISVSQAPNNTGLLAGVQRPNVVASVNPVLDRPDDAYDPSCGCIRWLNPAAWSAAAPFTIGNAPRTDARARTPGRRLVDLAIDKSIRVARGSLALRAEVINVLNARDFRGPNPQWGSTTFGEIRSDSGFPRTLQLRTRLAW